MSTQNEQNEAALADLERLQERTGLSVSQIADMLGISSSSIYQWKQGKTKISTAYRQNLKMRHRILDLEERLKGEQTVVTVIVTDEERTKMIQRIASGLEAKILS